MDEIKTNRDLYNIIKISRYSMDDFRSISSKICMGISTSLSEDVKKSLELSLRKFCTNLKKRWHESSRNEAQFLKKNASWLDNNFIFPTAFLSEKIRGYVILKRQKNVSVPVQIDIKHVGQKQSDRSIVVKNCSTRQK